MVNEPLLTLCLKISFSIDAIKMLAKATAILVPMAVPCVFPVKLHRERDRHSERRSVHLRRLHALSSAGVDREGLPPLDPYSRSVPDVERCGSWGALLSVHKVP